MLIAIQTECSRKTPLKVMPQMLNYNLYFVQEVYCTERTSLNPDFSEQIRTSAMLARVSFTVPVQKLNRLLVTRQPFALT